MSGPDPGIRLIELRWWHLPQVMALEAELFGDERWSEELFWSELAFCPPVLTGPASRRYRAAIGPASTGPEQVLGYAGLAVSDDEAYVQTVGVAAATQRRGIGGLLLTNLLELARSNGCATCWLEVRDDNTAAQSVYARYGFVVRGRRSGYYQPSGRDALVMSAPLRQALS